jgi:hypothetical protein
LNSNFKIFTPQKLAPNCTKTDRKSFTPSTEFERVCSRHATTTKSKERERGGGARQHLSGGYILIYPPHPWKCSISRVFALLPDLRMPF